MIKNLHMKGYLPGTRQLLSVFFLNLLRIPHKTSLCTKTSQLAQIVRVMNIFLQGEFVGLSFNVLLVYKFEVFVMGFTGCL